VQTIRRAQRKPADIGNDNLIRLHEPPLARDCHFTALVALPGGTSSISDYGRAPRFCTSVLYTQDLGAAMAVLGASRALNDTGGRTRAF
jgi:hypothetical protein